MYHPELKLTKMAMVALAEVIWDSEEIKNRVRNLVHEKSLAYWNEDVLQYVINQSKSLSQELPTKLQAEFEDVVIFIGEELCNWYKHLIEVLRLDFKYIEKTYLTSFGLIDGSKIMKNYWLPNRRLLKSTEKFDCGFEDLICMFGWESLIFESRYEIIDHMKKILSLSFMGSSKSVKMFERKIKGEVSRLTDKSEVVELILINWLCVQYKNLEPEDVLEINEGLESLPLTAEKIRSTELCKQILLMSLRLGCANLFQYFLGRWDCATDLVNSVIESCDKIHGRATDYERKKHLEMILILMKDMSEAKKSEIIENYCSLFLKLTYRCWPYQERFLDIFYAFSPDIMYLNIFNVLKIIAKKEMEDCRGGCLIKQKTHRSIFEDVVAQLEYLLADNEYKIPWEEYLSDPDLLVIHTLNMVLDCSVRLGEEIISIVTDFRFGPFDSFFLGSSLSIGKCLKKLGNKRDSITKKIKEQTLPRLLDTDNLEALNKVFAFSNKYQLGITKNDIDGLGHIKVQYGYQFDRAKTFIKWFYGPEDDGIMDVKSYFRAEEISRPYIFSLFYYKEARLEFDKDEVTKFLNFIFHSKKEIRHFRQNILLKDENSVLQFALYCDKLSKEMLNTELDWLYGWWNDYCFDCEDSFGCGCLSKDTLQNFFPLPQLIQFCELPEEKISELKTKCIDNMQHIMDSYASQCETFVVLHKLIKWATKTKEVRQKIIKEFMESDSNALMACDKMLNVFEDYVARFVNSEQVVVEFYNEWIKSCKNISELRESLEDKYSEILNDEDRKRFSDMFNKLERGDDLIFSDVYYFAIEQSRYY